MSTCSQEVEIYSKTTDKLISSGSMTCNNIQTLRNIGYRIVELSAPTQEQVIEQPVEQVIEQPVIEQPVEEEQVLINNISVEEIQQVNVIQPTQPTLRVEASNLLNVTLNLIEQIKTLKQQKTEIQLLNQSLKNENEELVSKFSDSATKQELEEMTQLFEQAYEKAKNYMLISIDNSRKRGYNQNNQQRDTSNALHADYTRQTENDFVIYATSINKIYNKKYSEGNW